MNDPKAILQEYLINSNAPAHVLNAMREIDEHMQVLDGYREAFWWHYPEYNSVDDMVQVVHRMNASNLSPMAKQAVTNFLFEDAQCDHSAGICYCALHEALNS